MRLQKKSISKVDLVALLRRRKSTLANFVAQSGITTYTKLQEVCDKMGVAPPPQKDFEAFVTQGGVPKNSSPAEGVVVIETPNIASEPHVTETSATLAEPIPQIKKKKRLVENE